MANLPTINSLEELLPALKVWQQKLRPVVGVPKAPRTPFNFRASSGASATGNALSWEFINGADGYVVYRSDNGNFSNPSIIARITDAKQLSYFDGLGASGITKYYRIAGTAGTDNQPQVIVGKQSATIKATSGSGTTTFDQTSGSSGNTGWNHPQSFRGRFSN